MSLAKIERELPDRAFTCAFRERRAHFAFDRRRDQAVVSVFRRRLHECRRRALFFEHARIDERKRHFAVHIDGDFEHLFAFAAVHGKHLMPLHLFNGRHKGVIITVYGILGILICGGRGDIGAVEVSFTQYAADFRVIRDPFSDDIRSARKRRGNVGNALLFVDILLRLFFGHRAVGRLRE